MKRIGVLLFILPVLLFSKEHAVPIGTSGNRLLFSVANNKSVPLNSVQVIVTAAPNWIQFSNIQTELDSIPVHETQDAEFIFSVQNGEAGKKGTVQVVVQDSQGQTIGRKEIDLITELSVKETQLFAPFPNPANPHATIQFALVQEAKVQLDIYNVLGQRVRTLVNEMKPAGQWQVVWDGSNDAGASVSSGMYIIQLLTTRNQLHQKYISKIAIKK